MKKCKFTQGYMAALALIVNSHGESREVKDAFLAMAMSEKEMNKCGVDKDDIEILKPIISEWEDSNN